MYRKLILLIFVFQNAYSLNDFDGYRKLLGDGSFIRKLRNDLGSFRTEAIFSGSYNQRYDVEEKYNFKFKDGQVNITYDSDNKKKLVWTYFNDFSEFYDIVEEKTCSNLIDDQVLKSKLIPWSPYSTIPSKFKMLGPSHLLFALIDNYDKNKENITCENTHGRGIRCDLYFDSKRKDKVVDKIEYYFYYRDDDEIRLFKIKSGDKEVEYLRFDYSFDRDKYQIDDFKIPIGLGCEKKENNKDPKIGTELGERFKLEYDAELEYLDLETKTDDVFLKTQFKFINWFMDTNFSFSIFDRFDLEAYKKVRTYLDGEIKLAYDIYDDKCVKYNFKDGFNRNWIDKLYDLSLLPHFFFINYNLKFSGISYLDEYKLGDQIYRVFEAKQYNYFSPKGDEKRTRTPFYSVVTHYYSKSNKKIPALIEIRIRGINGRLLGILKIKINKHNLALSSNSFNETIDLNQCFKNIKSTDYKELDLNFKSNSPLNYLNENYIKYEFRNLLDKNSIGSNFHLSPLRIHQISLNKENNFINLRAKILEPIDNADYFDVIKDLTLNDKNEYGSSRIMKNVSNQELCSRLCLQIVDCAAYSFNRSEICKLWTDQHFFGDIDNNYGFEWNRISTKSEPDSIIGRKMIKFYRREHLSTNYTLDFIEQLIKKNKFYLILKKTDNEKGIKLFYTGKLKSDKINFSKYLLYFIIGITMIVIISTIFLR